MPVVTDTDVRVLHAALIKQRDQLDSAVAKCALAGKLQGQDVLDWAGMKVAVDAYLIDEPAFFRAGSQMDSGQALQRELVEWAGKLREAGCLAPIQPDVGPRESLFGNLERIGMWIAIAMAIGEFGPQFAGAFGGGRRGGRRRRRR